MLSMMPRIISNSEVTAYNECARRHWYQYQQELQPRTYGIALTRGIIGHYVLEQYYKRILEGCSVDEAKDFALKELQNQVTYQISKNLTNYKLMQMLATLPALIEAYIDFYGEDEFEIISVESTHLAPIREGLLYGMKLDLLIKMTRGPFMGEKVIMDHKFLYNFKSDEELSIDGQLPKYIRTVAADGHFITRGVFNQIRYRELNNPDPDRIFRRTWVKPSKKAKEQIWAEQVSASVEIVDTPRPPRRTLSPLVCKNCYFLPICRTELNGENSNTIRKIDYMPLVDRYVDWSGD